MVQVSCMLQNWSNYTYSKLYLHIYIYLSLFTINRLFKEEVIIMGVNMGRMGVESMQLIV